jgi:hypothetical protein
MRSVGWWAVLALATSSVGACGARQKQAQAERQSFDCKERHVGYIATNHLGGEEVGVQMDCETRGPRIMRWRVLRDGTRFEDSRAMTPGDFDDVWKQIAGSGWEHLGDCTNGTLDESDPVFVFDVRDDQNTNVFKCQSRTMPYPYNTLVDPLDLAAHRGRPQLGEPEPDESLGGGAR